MVFRVEGLRRSFVPAIIGLAVIASPAPARAGETLQNLVAAKADYGVRNFYRQRDYRPLWFVDGRPGTAARRMIAIFRNAGADGTTIDPSRIELLERAVASAGSGDPSNVARAEFMLSSAWIDHVRAMSRDVDVGMTYIDASLRPAAPFPAAILTAAATAPSLTDHLDANAALNPLYDRMRDGLLRWRSQWAGLPQVTVPAGPVLKSGAEGPRVRALRARLGLPAGDLFDQTTARTVSAFRVAHGLGDAPTVDADTLAMLNRDPASVEAQLRLNLDRLRALPRAGAGKYIVVDAASARLYLYEDGVVQGSMKVVVGKPGEQTPMAAGLIRTMVLNPYWNVPPDLIRKRVAAKVLQQGVGYIRQARFEVLSGWDADARVIDPGTVDWAAVADGRESIRVRQLPGADNAMGAMKFLFPNNFGVYLHDTPDKALFSEADRNLSSGCVRLEDAPRLAKWLFGTIPSAKSAGPEQSVALARPVPVYLTYLTAGWDRSTFALRPDVYGRDKTAVRAESASLDRSGTTGN